MIDERVADREHLRHLHHLHPPRLPLIRSVPRHHLAPLISAAVPIDQVMRAMMHGKIKAFHHQADEVAIDDGVQKHR
jgi:hypothetical protein